MSAPPAARFSVHLESRRIQQPAFHLDAAAWATAAARHPALASIVEPSFGWDGQTLSRRLAHTDFLIGSRFDKAEVGASSRLKWIHTTGAGVDHLLPGASHEMCGETPDRPRPRLLSFRR